MDELSWFLSTISLRDYLPVARLIPGFPQDLRNPAAVKKQVEAALQYGYKKASSRRTSAPRIHLRELYQKISAEYLKGPTHLASTSVEDLILKLQVEPKIKPFQQIAILYTMFNEEFETLLTKLLVPEMNTSNPLEVLSEGNPVHNKLKLLIRRDSFEDLIPHIQHFLQKTKNNVNCQDLDHLFDELRNADKDSRLPILFSFLTTNDHHKQPDYQFLCDYAMQEYYTHHTEALQHEMAQIKADFDSQSREILKISNHLKELEKIETELKTQNKVLETLRSDNETAAAAYQEISAEKDKITAQRDHILQWREHFQGYLQELKVRGDQYVIVTKELDGIVGSTLSMKTLSREALGKIRKATWTSMYKDTMFFLLRNSCATTEEWLEMTELLHKHHVDYKEVTEYEEMGHLAQIIHYLLEEK